MPHRSRRFKLILLVLGALIVFLSGGMGYITHGLGETENLVIQAVDFSRVPDGLYTGAYTGYRWSNTVQVAVKDGKVTDIRMVKKQRFHLDGPVDQIIGRILAEQTLPVDVISGATATSKAIMKAVEIALTKN
jgi:uncharacterized protein with FMN-binding domain